MNNWPKDTISNLCHKIGDGLHGTPEYVNSSNIFFINGNNLENGKIVIDKNTKEISNKILEKYNIKLNDNSLLLSINGTIGDLAFYNNENVMLGKSVAFFNFKSDINRFYFYYFQLPGVQEFFYNNATGSTIKNLSLDTLNNLKVPVPRKEEYKKIVDCLSSFDKKINNNNEIKKEVISYIKLIFNYWFVQFDFPDKNNKPYKSNGGKMKWSNVYNREIPFNWTEEKIADSLSELECGDRPKGGIKEIKDGVPNIGAENIIGLGEYNYKKEKKVSNEFYSKMKQGIINSNDVLVYKDGAGLGQISMFKNDFPYKKSCINSHVFILRTNEKISQNYLYFWLDQKFMRDLIYRSGITSAQPGINQDDVQTFPILIPEKKIIQKFEYILDPLIDLIFEKSKENKRIQDLKEMYLQMLMNGQLESINT